MNKTFGTKNEKIKTELNTLALRKKYLYSAIRLTVGIAVTVIAFFPI